MKITLVGSLSKISSQQNQTDNTHRCSWRGSPQPSRGISKKRISPLVGSARGFTERAAERKKERW